MTIRHLVVGFCKMVGLVIVFAVLLTVGARLFPSIPPNAPPLTPAEQQQAALGLLLIAVMDTAILGAVAWSSRLRGWRLWLMLSTVTYGVMTFTSQLEAGYFMTNVTADMLPNLLAMTLPVTVLHPLVLVVVLGRWKPAPECAPAWRGPAMARGEFAVKLAVLSAVVYPVLFFGAGYFIAWQSPEVRQFYSGSTELLGAMEHYRSLFSRDPLVYPFEIMRGLLWIALALPVLRTTRGRAWLGPLLVALLFCLVQNNLHLVPNPLMPPEVRLFHFVETGSSNIVWAVCIGWLLHRSHVSVPSTASGALRHAASA